MRYKVIIALILAPIAAMSIYSSVQPATGDCEQIPGGQCIDKSFIGIDFFVFRVGYVQVTTWREDWRIGKQGEKIEKVEKGIGIGPSIIRDDHNLELAALILQCRSYGLDCSR